MHSSSPAKKLMSESGSVGSFIVMLILAGILALVWFIYLSPFLIDQRIGLANLKFEFNKFSEAKDLYENLLKKVPKDFQELISDRIAQIPLAEKHLVDIEPDNPSILLRPIECVRAKIGLIFIHYTLQNNGKKPIPIRRNFFYLKSNIGKSEVALDRPQNREVNSWIGNLGSGERVEGGICVKYYLIDPDEKISLIYNNGEIYVNTPIPLESIVGQSSKDQFADGWLGKKVSPFQNQAESPNLEAGSQKEQLIRSPSSSSSVQLPVSSSANINSPSSNSVQSPKLTQPSAFQAKVPQKPPTQPMPPSRKLPTTPGLYVSSSYKFSIQLPPGWQEMGSSGIAGNSFMNYVSFAAIFKGPTWKGNFPILMVQKVNIYESEVAINSKILNDLEKELRQNLKYQGIQIRQLKSRTTLFGNTQAAEIDLTLDFNKQSFHMLSYLMEGRTGFIISYVALSSDFNAYSNPAIQAIRSFKANL